MDEVGGAADRDRAGACARCSFRPSSSPAFPASSTVSSLSRSRARPSFPLMVSLTLSPAMCALLLKPRRTRASKAWWQWPIRGFFRAFNWGFERFAGGYHWLIGRAVRFVVDHARCLCRHSRLWPERVSQDADRLHSAGRSRLSDRGAAIAAGSVLVAHRRGPATRRRRLPRDRRASRMPSTSSDSTARPSRKAPNSGADLPDARSLGPACA